MPSENPKLLYSDELKAATEAATLAGAFVRAHVGKVGQDAIRDKGVHDLVTFVDEEAERIIGEHLAGLFPDIEMLGEEGAEGDVNPTTEGKRWIVDPLDGTTNFNHEIPPYAVSIALQDGEELVLGVVYDVSHDELFAAQQGGGLTLNGQAAATSQTTTMGSALIATGFPFRDYRYVEGYLKSLEAVMRETRGLRRHGAAAVDLAWVACGRFDGFFEAGLAPWDIAAGSVLVREGGGWISGLPTGTDPVFDGGIVATNLNLCQRLIGMVEPLGQEYMRNVLNQRQIGVSWS